MARSGKGRKGSKRVVKHADPNKEGRGSGRTTAASRNRYRPSSGLGYTARPSYNTSVEDGRAVMRSDVYGSIMKSAPVRGTRKRTGKSRPAIDLGDK